MECKLDNINIHYEIIGEGRPIVMLHGYAMDHSVRMAVMEPIFTNRHGWKRIYPDLPGRGETPAKDWITTEDQVLDILLEFIDKVIPDQTYVIAGASYGGYLAQGVVYRRARQIDGLLLSVPAVQTPEGKGILPKHVTLLEDNELLTDLSPDESAIVKGAVVVQRSVVIEAIRNLLIPASNRADREFLTRMEENLTFSFDVSRLPEPFDKPTLIITGRQDASCGFHGAWSILDNYPRATFAVLDFAGHWLEGEQADLVSALVNEWLDRVEQYSK